MKKIIKRKPFDKELYNKHDKSSKEFGKELIEELNKRVVIIPEENYEGDLLLKHPSIRSLDRTIEVQTAACWGDNEFPFDSLHLPKAKVDRLMKIHGNDIYFMVQNNPKNRALMVKASKFVTQKEISKTNKYSTNEPEVFYEVDLELCEFYLV